VRCLIIQISIVA